MELAEEIRSIISEGDDVFLVGPTESGKSWFTVNELIPYLKENKLKVEYFPDELLSLREGKPLSTPNKKTDVIIFDEVETFLDKEFLGKRHPEENPYYEDSYIKNVNKTHENFKTINTRGIYIVTRNEKAEINNLKSYHFSDWGTDIQTIEFKRS